MAIDDNTTYGLTGAQVKDLASKVNAKADASAIPTVNDATLTITQNGTSAGTFTANASSNATIALTDTTYSAFGGATSSAAGSAGLVPAPTTSDTGKYLKGDGTWATANAELVEMSYGESSAWAKFIAAYTAKQIVYCRASSNSNPASGSQTRKAFMAYVNNADSPTTVEFQYVRSISSHSATQQGDQVFVYTLTSSNGGTWSVSTREMSTKVTTDSSLTNSYSSGTLTIKANTMTGATSSANGSKGYVPQPSSGDQGKFLRGDGTWANAIANYSTSEIETPYTWTDGKTIYRKVIEKTIDGVTAGESNIPHSISNFGELVSMNATFKLGWETADTWGTDLYLNKAGITFRINATNIIMECANTNNWEGVIKFTLEYTKSS